MNVPKLRFKDNNDNDYPQWEKKLIKDILKIYHGKDYKNEPNEKKLYPVLGTGGIITYIDKFLCDWECVLIGRKGTINKPQYMKTPFWSVDTLFYSKPKLKQNPKFQYYLFQNINWKIYDESTGVPSLSASTIEHINKLIPIYAEQEKIANFLTTVDKKITNLENIITSLENQKKGLLQQIFNQKLRFKDENGNNYPNWEKKKLGELFIFKQGYQIPAEKQLKIYKEGYLRYLYISDFLSNKNILYVKKDDMDTINKSDIAIANTGNTSGKFFRGQSGILSNNMFVIKNDEKFILNDFLFFYLETDLYDTQLKKFFNSSGQPHLGHKNMSNITIIYPQKQEQTKIADFLSAFDRKIDNQKAQLEHWQQIKKGLLQQMFV